jgi:hypothetical protein
MGWIGLKGRRMHFIAGWRITSPAPRRPARLRPPTSTRRAGVGRAERSRGAGPRADLSPRQPWGRPHRPALGQQVVPTRAPSPLGVAPVDSSNVATSEGRSLIVGGDDDRPPLGELGAVMTVKAAVPVDCSFWLRTGRNAGVDELPPRTAVAQSGVFLQVARRRRLRSIVIGSGQCFLMARVRRSSAAQPRCRTGSGTPATVVKWLASCGRSRCRASRLGQDPASQCIG